MVIYFGYNKPSTYKIQSSFISGNPFTDIDIIPAWLGTHTLHDDVIKWKHFPRNWPFVREIHRSSVNFPHKGQWRGALMFSLMYAWINDWVNNREAGDLRRQHGHYDVIVMLSKCGMKFFINSETSTAAPLKFGYNSHSIMDVITYLCWN